MAGFQQAQGNTVADDARSTRNEDRAETWIKCEFPKSWDHTGQSLSCLLDETHNVVEFGQKHSNCEQFVGVLDFDDVIILADDISML
jgi:hypothetical protein